MELPIWTDSLFIAWCFQLVYSQSTFYCLNTQIQSVVSNGSTIYIKTTKPGSQHYDNNMKCSWMIDAGADNRRVQVSIQSSSFQWSPQYTTCSGYDNLLFVEGQSSRGASITSMCDARNPHNVVSKGRYMFIQFTTTHQNFGSHIGAHMAVDVFESGQCPPGWFQSSEKSAYCYMMRPGAKEAWARSQEICTYSQANLAFINSPTEYNTILDAGRNTTGMKVGWIGLSDIGEEGQLRWLDSTAPSFQRPLTGQKYNHDCVAQDFAGGNWVMGDCERVKISYICKARKDGNTKLYQAGTISKPPEEKSDGTNLFHIVIVVVVIVIAIGVGIFVYFFCYRRGRCCWKSRSRTVTRDEDWSHQSVGLQSRDKDDFPPPPAYHDVVGT